MWQRVQKRTCRPESGHPDRPRSSERGPVKGSKRLPRKDGGCDRKSAGVNAYSYPSAAFTRSGVIGNLQHARAHGVEDRVGQRRAHGDDGRLAAAQRRRLRIVHQHNLDLRQPGESRHPVAVEVGVKHVPVAERALPRSARSPGPLSRRLRPAAAFRRGSTTRPTSSAITTRFTSTAPVARFTATSTMVALQAFEYMPHAIPVPRPVGARPAVHPNCPAAVSSTRRIRGFLVRLFSRNSSGSISPSPPTCRCAIPARTCCCSPTARATRRPSNGFMPGGFPPIHPPAEVTRLFGMS